MLSDHIQRRWARKETSLGVRYMDRPLATPAYNALFGDVGLRDDVPQSFKVCRKGPTKKEFLDEFWWIRRNKRSRYLPLCTSGGWEPCGTGIFILVRAEGLRPFIWHYLFYFDCHSRTGDSTQFSVWLGKIRGKTLVK